MTEHATIDQDERALRRLLANPRDEAAAEVVLGRVVPRVAAFVRRRYPMLAAEDAADAAREALTIAIERRALYDASRGAQATTWLHGIARLRAADFLRKRVADHRLADELAADGPPDASSAAVRRATAERYGAPPVDSKLQEKVRAAIEALPSQQRRAAEAHYLDGRTPRDVDEQFGWRPNTANVYLSHARRAMRQRLADVVPGTSSAPVAMGATCRTRQRLHRRTHLRMGLAIVA
jgi:RNA polymerase sigma factor (sigma-70 family)